MTFGEYAARWLAGRTFDPSRYEATELRLRIHVLPVIGSMELRKIKPSAIQSLLQSLDLAETYRRVIFANVSAVFAAAVDDELIAKNPCQARSVSRPSTTRRKVVPWEAAWVSAMHDELPKRYRIVVTLGAGLGLRQGEIVGLSPGDVDFLRRTVTVQRQVKLFGGNRQVFAPPKGGKTRSVPLPSSVAQELGAHLARFDPVTVTLPWRMVDNVETASIPLIVSTRERRALNRNYFNMGIWKPAQRRAGVPSSRDNGTHALRHWYASVLLDAGESIRAVSEYLGHSDPGFTLRTYTHLMPSSAERTRSAVDAALTAERRGDIEALH